MFGLAPPLRRTNHDPESDIVSLYYGAGDSALALATARLRDLLDHVTQASAPRHRQLADGDAW